jgi:mRNA interferase MazF
MKRGDFVTIAMQGDFGKPRPALVVQSDSFNQAHPSVTVLPVSSELVNAPLFRIAVEPNDSNGLSKPSQVMVDKAITVRLGRAGAPFGKADDALMLAVNRSLAVFLGIAA